MYVDEKDTLDDGGKEIKGCREGEREGEGGRKEEKNDYGMYKRGSISKAIRKKKERR
jgi:hypothetical protein